MKIVGIILLCILLFILLIIALVLFVPIRYSLKLLCGKDAGGGEDGKPFRGDARVSWLLKIIRAEVSYEKGLSYKASILWKTVVSSDSKDKKSKSDEAVSDGDFWEEIDKDAADDKPDRGESAADQIKGSETSPDSNLKNDADIRTGEKKDDTPKPSISDRLKKASESIGKSGGKIRDMSDKLQKGAESVRKTYHMISAESTQRLAGLILDTVGRLLRSVGPKNIKGLIDFGFDDPSTTGQVLEYAAILFPLYGRGLSVRPDFEEKRLDCDIKINGRIYLFYLLYLVLRVWFNADFRRFRREYKKNREEHDRG